MLSRAACALGLAAALWLLLEPEKNASTARRVLTAALLAALGATAMSWTRAVLAFPDTLPPEIAPGSALAAASAGMALAVAAFAAAGASARRAAAFGALLAAMGFCASRWPQLARAVELSGGVFAGPAAAALLPWALAASAALCAAALTRPEFGRRGPALALAVAAFWAAGTLAVEASLTRWWGFGPRSLAEAAGIPTNEEAPRLTVLRLSPNRGRSYRREPLRMAGEGVDLSPDSLERLDEFLRRTNYRGVFAAEALADLRLGWRQWWDPERALAADMLVVPGRVHPDYRAALALLRAGPITRERRAALARLDAAAQASSAGFEDVDESQYIFEGFAAAYARFNDEDGERRWLYRTDSLWAFSDRKVEITPLDEFHSGRVAGSVLLDGRPALAVRVGLFLVETSSATGATTRLLSQAAFPDENGAFSFDHLSSGIYELSLMGRVSDLNGRLSQSPGLLQIGEMTPDAILPPIRIDRDVLPAPEAFSPSGLPQAPTPEIPEQALRLPRR